MLIFVSIDLVKEIDVKNKIETQGSVPFLSGIDEEKIHEEIAFFENKLEQVGVPGDDLYKKALVNAFQGLLDSCRDQLFMNQAVG